VAGFADASHRRKESIMKVDVNGPLAASALSVAASLIEQQFGPLNANDSAESLAQRVNSIVKTAEGLIRTFFVAVEQSPRPKKS
jgi:hypothetical protein